MSNSEPPKVGDKFAVPGGGEDGDDVELTVREIVENDDLVDGYFEVIAEEDMESYEIHNDGAGWAAD